MSKFENKKNEEGNEITAQANKKHRVKSKKLEKREKIRKDKKKDKNSRHYISEIKKIIKNSFKDHKKYIYMDSLPLDFSEIEKYIKKLYNINPDSGKEIAELFYEMENNGNEVDISDMENLDCQKYLVKLFKKMRINSIGFKKPFTFKIIKKNHDIKQKFTTDEKDILNDSLESYGLFIESFFEAVKLIESRTIIKREENKTKERKIGYYALEENENSNNDEENEDDEDDDKDYSSDIDDEYQEIENTVGNNAELINKTFDSILRDENKKKQKSNDEILQHCKNLGKNVIISKDTTITNEDLNNYENNNNSIGPNIDDFLKSTLSILKTQNIDNDLNGVINQNTFLHNKKYGEKTLFNQNYLEKKNNEANKVSVNFINQKSYDQIVNNKDLNKKLPLKENIKEERKSMLEEHKEKNFISNSKNSGSYLSQIENKNVLNLFQNKNSLNSRFGSKETI